MPLNWIRHIAHFTVIFAFVYLTNPFLQQFGLLVSSLVIGLVCGTIIWVLDKLTDRLASK